MGKLLSALWGEAGMGLKAWLLKQLVDWLNFEKPFDGEPPCDFDRLSFEVQPCDVVLVEGRTRVSNIIKTITISPWTHSALYIGRLHDIENPDLQGIIQRYYDGDPTDQLIIEPLLGEGTVIRSLDVYRGEHLRICRPKGLDRQDMQTVIAGAAAHLGVEYDIRQLVDLARFLFPFGLVPKRWRSTLFEHHAGEQTKTVCSTMIAEVFASVHYPVLPVIHRNKKGGLRMHKRNTRLYTPSDFDYSPYFEIIKYPILGFDDVAMYRQLPWDKDGLVCNAVGDCYIPSNKDGLKNVLAQQVESGVGPSVEVDSTLPRTDDNRSSLSNRA